MDEATSNKLRIQYIEIHRKNLGLTDEQVNMMVNMLAAGKGHVIINAGRQAGKSVFAKAWQEIEQSFIKEMPEKVMLI